MCGICGYITKQNISAACLMEMNDTMIHRGPEDSGIYRSAIGDFSLGLGHRRLAIIDLSPAGHQPMFAADGKIGIVFNGEIYNFPVLRDELSQRGHKFHSNSDTEVILESYLEWGIDCVNRFNGMFAFCLVDFRKDIVHFARDRVGKKPLYYYFDGDSLVFGSELKALMTFPGFIKNIRQDVIARYLFRGYIAAPDTIFENTCKLMAGHTMTWQGGKISSHSFWNVADSRKKSQIPPLSYEDAKEDLHSLLIDAVEKRMLADVPLGTFLSGGIDSTLITALAQKVSLEPVKTYSIGFENPIYDEAPYARQVAAHLKTDHNEMYVSEDAFISAMDDLPHYYDEPFADSSQIPTMLVSQFARESVTVVLSGDGGDEIFCGYNEYDKVFQAQQLLFLSGILGCISLIPILPHKVRKLSEIYAHRQARSQLITNEKESIVQRLLISRDQLPVWYRREQNINEPNWQLRRMLLDVQTYMSDDILVKVDRAAMRYALETRCPLLDHRVIEFVFSLPHEYVYAKKEKKRILKDILYEYVPKKLMDRPKKGFSIPIGHYLRTTKLELLWQLTNEPMLRDQGIFQPQASSTLVRNFIAGDDSQENLVWKYCMFQQWFEKYMS